MTDRLPGESYLCSGLSYSMPLPVVIEKSDEAPVSHRPPDAAQGGPRRLTWVLPIWLLALIAALLISGCGFFADYLIHNADRLLASDIYTLLIAFVFSYALLSYEGRRRKLLQRRMEVAAEVNHHIRNALTGVVFTAAVQNDPALAEVLRDATDRIDWVLTDVLPDGAEDLRWPVQSRTWKPIGWANRRIKD